MRPPVPVASAHAETQPPMALPRQRESRGSRSQRALFLTILALVALIIVSIPIGYTVLNHAGTSSPTPGVQTTQSAAQATASHAAATVNAQASATAGPLATATAGQPAYQDALTDANNPATAAATWDQDGQCAFASDGYHITQPASFPYFKGCREQSNTYGNLALSVNVNIFNGHSAGIFFRLNTNLLGNYDGYLFEIDNQGSYKISREQGTSVIPLKDWAASTALHTGYHVNNLLQLIARGNTFLFYANGKYLGQVQNDYLGQPGTIGFLTTAVSGGSDAEVVYSDLKMYNA